MRYLKILIILLFCLSSLSAQGQDDRKLLRAGVASMITPVSAVRYYQQAVEYLGKKLGVEAEMVHRTTYDEIDTMLEGGQVDVAFICSSPYVIDNDAFGAELLVAPVVNEVPFYHSNIIVHRDSEARTFESLRGQSFAFVDPKSNTGRLYPTYVLAKMHERVESFFSTTVYSYSHNKSVELVAKKRVGAAAVDSIVYNFMVASGSPYTRETKIIHRSPRFGIPPVVVPPGTSAYMKDRLRQIFLNMHKDPEGQPILAAMKIERFIEVPDSNYDSIRAMRTFIKNNRAPLPATTAEAASPSEDNTSTIHLGIVPRDDPRESYERYQPLVDYLSEVTGEKMELRLETSYKEVVNSLGRGRSSFAILGPLTYLDAYSRYGATPIARSRTARGEMYYRSVIVTDIDGSIKELSELVDKKFAFAATWSTSGNLIPRYMLAWAGIHLDNLREFKHFNYHGSIAKKVLSDQFDAGGMRYSTAEKYLPYGLKIIATSAPIPTGPVVVSPETPYEVMEKVREALLSMGESDKGRGVLAKLDPDLQGGFFPASDVDYSKIRKMINDVPLGCGKNCHPKRKL